MTEIDLNSLLDTALERRRPLLQQWHDEATDCYRLFHGTSEGMAGVTVDRYGPQLIIQSFHQPLSAEQLAQICDRINDWLQQQGDEPLDGFYRDRTTNSGQALELGEADVDRCANNEAICHELGVKYRSRGIHRGIDPLLFLDLRAGRRFIQSQARGLSVLNLFSYTCGVGVVAAKAGAAAVVNVDFSRSSLAVGRENAALNQLEAQQIDFIQSDFFPAIQQLAGLPVKFRRNRGARPPKPYPRLQAQQFDLVFLDPPRWAKSPFGTVDLIRDYPSVFKPSLLATKPGGRLVCTNNVAQVDRDDWLGQLKRSAAKAGRPVKAIELLEPEADFPSFDGRHPLKLAVLEV